MIFVNVLDPKFLSTPSARRATDLVRLSGRGWFISIHALREEGDTVSPSEIIVDKEISIHALREEGDPPKLPFSHRPAISIHALREEGDVDCIHFLPVDDISIHALREEGDLGAQLLHILAHDFYPRPPRGGRRICHQIGSLIYVISIHALREEGDALYNNKGQLNNDFYPRPPRGGRLPLRVGDLDGNQISIHALREEGDQSCQAAQAQ